MNPEVSRWGFLSMQVCVPKDFTNKQVLDFAEEANPCGTANGWTIRKEGNKDLSGMPERNPCEQREGCVHIILDA